MPSSSGGYSKVELIDLDPSTMYTYSLYVSNQNVGGGSFTTAPPKDRVRFEWMLTSCMRYRDYPDQTVWETAILPRKPALQVLAGDTMYLAASSNDW